MYYTSEIIFHLGLQRATLTWHMVHLNYARMPNTHEALITEFFASMMVLSFNPPFMQGWVVTTQQLTKCQ